MKGPQKFLKSNEIEESIVQNGKNKITFVYGDGGGSYRLPRVDCRIIGNNKHSVNGIGDFMNDKILVISNKKLYVMGL